MPSDLMWIAIKLDRQGDGKFLKDSDGVQRHSKIGLVL